MLKKQQTFCSKHPKKTLIGLKYIIWGQISQLLYEKILSFLPSNMEKTEFSDSATGCST